jgi:4-hydroxythreonine-4-phosphate dehydrogenase
LLADSRVSFVFVGPENTGSYEGDFISIGKWEPIRGAAGAGRLAGLAIERAVQMALDQEVDGIVTAPIDKFALHAGGYEFPGHTEMLAALAGNPPVAMMMTAERTSGNPLRVVLATTHLALASVPQAVTTALLVEQALLTHEALALSWRIVEPRLALCALNPHGSDGGLFGDEERRIMEPAVNQLINHGVRMVGPIPADTVFIRALRGEFDAVIAPYHDVGMAAFKTAAFGHGVNVTLGLPFVRTSPDHGTAIDIAGTGAADSSSMEEAIRLAIMLATQKKTCENDPV